MKIEKMDFEHVKSSNNDFLSISLYLFLMIFFVLLVSVTKLQKTRQEQAISSVSKQFRGENDDEDLGPEFSNEILEMEELNYIKRIRESLPNNFTEEKLPAHAEELVKASSSIDDFFRPNEKRFKATQKEFLEKIATLSNSENKSKDKIKIKIALNGDNLLKNRDILETNSNRLSNLVAFLVWNLGVEKDLVEIAFDDTAQDRIEFSFKINYLPEENSQTPK